jgi:hypothetical protein
LGAIKVVKVQIEKDEIEYLVETTDLQDERLKLIIILTFLWQNSKDGKITYCN